MATNILTEYSDRVRYFLHSKSFGSIKINDPIGWDEDEKEFTRNKESHGVFTTLSNSLKFTKEAKDFIEIVRLTEGINADLILTKEVKNDFTDVWEVAYSGYLDLGSREVQNNQISLKFNAGGLESLIKNREGDEVEIDRLESIDGKTLSKFNTSLVQLKGRNIFLKSTWEAEPMSYYKQLFVFSTDGNTRTLSNTFPFKLVTKSHEQAASTFDATDGNKDIGASTMMLLYNIDRKRKFEVNIENLKFLCYTLHSDLIDWGHVTISLTKYKNGEALNRGDSITLWNRVAKDKSDDPFPNLSGVQNIDANHVITLEKEESLGLEIIIWVDFYFHWTSAGATRRRDFFYKLQSGKITIKEDSEFKPTICKAIKPYDLANRLVEIISGRKNAIKSEILQNGKWKDLMLTHGFWIRGFSKENDLSLPEDDRKFKPLTTSLKDFISSFSAVCNIGVGIEKIGAREYVVIEDLKHFYNRNVTIKLPFQVKNVKRSTDASGYYKSLEFGYEKGGEYEEAMGLDEYNTRNTYSTCVHKVDNVFTKISKYRADSYGIEFARRKPFTDYSTEDTNYDQDIFLIDCKEDRIIMNIPIFPWSNNSITIEVSTVRLWQDDFQNIPTGVYSPNTAFNLRLSPFNNLLRHGWYFGSSLTVYPNQKIRYASSKGNSTLKTIYAENGEILNKELERPRFEPEMIEFEHQCNSEIMKMVEGRQTILGRDVRNCYGLVEFINENGELERGFLMSLKPNGAGNWKLLKYYK